eukprot:TRINITY_DN46952_c0_g2_i1.p1 TRINITY_DN46952_c0_g2~~TRINITY_DN46952_c0_g2_i1.p1  ORF type:complete len:425 (-),score=103.32 TRINITY_DN46952_c0_g2_i1:410-1684(-)
MAPAIDLDLSEDEAPGAAAGSRTAPDRAQPSPKRAKRTCQAADVEVIDLDDEPLEPVIEAEASEQKSPCSGDRLLRLNEAKASQILRIPAGKAAAIAGLSRFDDVGELFMEFLYQDLSKLYVHDAALLGLEVELVSEESVRRDLVEKSGCAKLLEEVQKTAKAAEDAQAVNAACRKVDEVLKIPAPDSKLSDGELQELRKLLLKDIRCGYGSRREDPVLEAYEDIVRTRVYGKQRWLSQRLPKGGASEALATLCAPRRADAGGANEPQAAVAKDATYFKLVGKVDGFVDITVQGEASKVVVEVKNRTTRMVDPPEVNDVIQLCTYCRILGLEHGHLVQSLRTTRRDKQKQGTDDTRDVLVSRLSFAAGSMHRKGWDGTVLPSLYAFADAIYAARRDDGLRYRLVAADAAERQAIVESLCPHLAR